MMLNAQFPFSTAVDAAADEGARLTWNSYEVNVPYVFNNQWTAFDCALLPSTSEHQDGFSQWHDITGTPSQHALTPDKTGSIPYSDQTYSQIDQNYRSFTAKLQSSVQEFAALVPPNSPSSSYNQLKHEETTMKNPKKQPRRRKIPLSDEVPATKSSRRKSTLDKDTNILRKNQVSMSSVPRDEAGRGSAKSKVWKNTKLERNRKAANLCRIRKRESNEKLESAEKKMEQRHIKLSSEVEALTTEIYWLKCEILLHSDCNCTLIQSYLANGFERNISWAAK
ncbi:hypothetical protein BGZ63DRAFT_391140 [Mariannaea sp. PMI_226]|nr:hypothetical protein BGZ63DRAFT_391140 [Mariannaea sp. PMI_226]